MAWLDDILTVLESGSVGSGGIDIWLTLQAAVPRLPNGSATLHIVETSGSGPERIQNNVIRPAFLKPSAQLVARADDSAAAEAMARAAYNALFPVRNQMVNSGWYRSIKPIQEPYDLNVDLNAQAQWGFNVHGDYNRRD